MKQHVWPNLSNYLTVNNSNSARLKERTNSMQFLNWYTATILHCVCLFFRFLMHRTEEGANGLVEMLSVVCEPCLHVRAPLERIRWASRLWVRCLKRAVEYRGRKIPNICLEEKYVKNVWFPPSCRVSLVSLCPAFNISIHFCAFPGKQHFCPFLFTQFYCVKINLKNVTSTICFLSIYSYGRKENQNCVKKYCILFFCLFLCFYIFFIVFCFCLICYI